MATLQPSTAALAQPIEAEKLGARGQVAPQCQSRWVALGFLACIAAIWGIELWWMQHLSMPNHHSGGPRFDVWAPKIRFVLDLFFASTLCLLLPKRLLIAAFILMWAGSIGLVAYAQFFNNSLSILTLMNGWREAAMLAGSVWEWLPKFPMLVLTISVVAKCALLIKLDCKAISIPLRWRLGLVALLGYATLFFATTFVSPLNRIATTQGVARVGRIRGYLGPWAAELYYLNSAKLLESAVKRANYKSNQLTPLEYPLTIHDHLVVIQAESLDFNVLGHTANGREITPFLNQLRDRALFYKARAYHRLGSADADFTMLLGGPPASNVLNYSIPGFPYEQALPHFLAQYDFSTWAFHGNYGSFYKRADAFRKMGFAKILFREQLEAKFPVSLDSLGIKDADVFNASSLLLREARGRQCHFIITLTSHSPYQFVRPDSSYPLPHAKTLYERYLNHAHYLDRCLRDYVTSLQKNATVLIYADHPTEVRNRDFKPCVERGFKYVPVFIYDTSRDLAKLQQTRATGVATSGDLTMIDISTYLRNRVRATFAKLTTTASSE